MSLEKYLRKRDLDKTPEPGQGKGSKKAGPIFVVQKHAARRLHYDFRIEADGVLKSWAVPKGPPFNNEERRLAMMVEDHPYDYKDFEGIIPQGNYGAGTVMVWDRGTFRWLSEMDFGKRLRKGKLTFILDGQKLKGEFALVKLKGAKEPNAWLMIKATKDADIKPGKNFERSALTGRTMEEIAGSQAKLPRTIAPMKAKISPEPFDDPGWVFEIKYDGYRIIARLENKQVNLFLRGGKIFNEQFKEIREALTKLKFDAVLDGEVVALDRDGKMDFQTLQNHLRGNKKPLIYYVFDILYYNGRNLTKLPLLERKKILKAVLPNLPNIKYADHVEGEGKKFFKLAIKEGLEGIMAKEKSGFYLPGKRVGDWRKIKAHHQQEAVVAGFTEPRGIRKDLGALILGVYQKGELAYAGHVGTGFSQKDLAEIKKKLKPYATKKPPFKNTPQTNAPATWIKPKFVAEVAFLEWTGDGVMRHPVFKGFREDKMPEEVCREDT